jgi:hypothetical protein
MTTIVVAVIVVLVTWSACALALGTLIGRAFARGQQIAEQDRSLLSGEPLERDEVSPADRLRVPEPRTSPSETRTAAGL